MKNVNLVIVNYNTSKYVGDLIGSISENDMELINRIVIVENNSKDSDSQFLNHLLYDFSRKNGFYYNELESLGDISNCKNSIIYYKSPVNGGFAYGNNVVLKEFVCFKSNEYIWMVNPDIEIIGNSICEQIKTYETSTILGSLLLNQDGTVQCYGGGTVNKIFGVAFKNKSNRPIDYISGASMFFDVKTLKDIGLMPEEYFLYWEETDWCKQATNNGIKLKICESSRLSHIESVSTGLRSKFQYQQDMKNTVRYFLKYHSIFTLFTIVIIKPIINNISYVKRTKIKTIKPWIWSMAALIKVSN